MTEHFFPWYLNTEILMFSWCWKIIKHICTAWLTLLFSVGYYDKICESRLQGEKKDGLIHTSMLWHKAKHRDVSSKACESSFHEPPDFLCVRSELGFLLSVIAISIWWAINSRNKKFRLFEIRLPRNGSNTAFMQATSVNLVLLLISLFLPFSKCTSNYKKQIILSNPISSVKLLLETQQQNYLHYLLI